MNDDNPLSMTKAPEFIFSMMDHVMHAMRQSGHSIEHSYQIALTAACSFCEAWRGVQFRVPAGVWNGRRLPWYELEARDWQIYREYDGTNRAEICERYRISEARLYQIITYIRSADRKR